MGHGTGRDRALSFSSSFCLSHSSSRCTKTLSVFVCLTEQADVFKSIPGGFGVLSVLTDSKYIRLIFKLKQAKMQAASTFFMRAF